MQSRSTDKYKSDPAYRDLQNKRVKAYYWRKRPVVQRASPEVFKTDLYANIKIKNEQDPRSGNTFTVPIYKVGTLALILGISTQSVRLWEEKGVLPQSTITISGEESRPVRGYTYDQVRLIWELSILRNFSDSRGDEFSPFARILKRRWAEMPDGVQAEAA